MPSYCCPADQHRNACAPFRHLNLVQENPLGARLVTRRRTVQVSWRKVWNLKLHNDPNTTKQDKDSWAFASPGKN